MAEHKQLTRPPLREALIDLRLAEELSLPVITQIGQERLPGFEPPVPMWRGQFTFPVGPPTTPPPPIAQANEAFGWRYSTSDGARIVLFRRDGATFSVLRGYTTWAEAKASAQAIWRQYCERGRVTSVARLAVRYINVIAFPVGADTDIYLTAGPRLPPGVPNMLNGFLQRVVIPFSDDGTSAIVTQALEQSGDAATSSVVLDIDVWRAFRYAANSPEIWSTLDILRAIKNRIFFGSVTEKALEPYL